MLKKVSGQTATQLLNIKFGPELIEQKWGGGNGRKVL